MTVDTALGLPLGIIQITGESRRTRGSPRTNIWYSVCPFWTPYSGLTCGAIESGDPIVPSGSLGSTLGPRRPPLTFITWNADATFWTLGSQGSSAAVWGAIEVITSRTHGTRGTPWSGYRNPGVTFFTGVTLIPGIPRGPLWAGFATWASNHGAHGTTIPGGSLGSRKSLWTLWAGLPGVPG